MSRDQGHQKVKGQVLWFTEHVLSQKFG